jgi:2-oxoglutarate ferredoxin oxidoreductase subunit gamma
MSKQIRLSGSGGQGMLLAGIILSEAAIINDKNAVQTQSYGPEARGGASKSEVIISDEKIAYPKVTLPDIMLALTQEAYDKYAVDMNDNGILVVDDTITLSGNDKCEVMALPIIKSARDDLGKVIVANIIALGALTKASGVVSEESLEKAVLKRVPKGTEELNKKALQTGFKLVAYK